MEEPKDKNKHFYIMALITILIFGGVVWEIFFSEGPGEHMEPTFRRAPEVDFIFLNSRAFNRLDDFKRGDDPLLPWQKARKLNPFRATGIPENEGLLKWWEFFNFEFEIEDRGWVGKSPGVILESVDPVLIIFEGRWYEFSWKDKIERPHSFEIRDEEGEPIFILTEKDEAIERYTVESEVKGSVHKIIFQAEKGIESYNYLTEDEEFSGRIMVVSEDEYEEGVFDRGDAMEELLSNGGNLLADFYAQLQEFETEDEELLTYLHQFYFDAGSRLDDIRLDYYNPETSNEALEAQLNDLINEIEINIEEMVI